MGRIYSIDFLRGLMASLVMIYHFTSWSVGGLDASSILSRFGLYAVSIFYIISGYALAHVYSRKKVFTINYCSARFFRIAPLFYAVSIAFLIKAALFNMEINVFDTFLNFSFLFAIVDPSAYLATGAWSIGNEMFFYLLLLFAIKSGRYKVILFLMLFISILLFVFFRFVKLETESTLPSQWGIYINPLNHVLFFIVGMVLFNMSSFIHRYAEILFLMAVLFSLLIFVYPVSGDRITLVTGWASLVMFISSVGIFLSFLILDRYDIFSHYVLRLLGDISYSVYLLHPLIWFASSRLLEELPLQYIIMLSILFTFVVSWFSFEFFEKPAIRFGRRYVRRAKYS